jgi:hypothetical protein
VQSRNVTVHLSFLRRQEEDVLWQAFSMAAPARRRVFARAPNVERERPLPCSTLRPEQRTTTADAPMGPKAPKRTAVEEAIAVAFRQKTLLPLDEVLGCLRDTIPNLSRSALHRRLQRHGISRLPKEEASGEPIVATGKAEMFIQGSPLRKCRFSARGVALLGIR